MLAHFQKRISCAEGGQEDLSKPSCQSPRQGEPLTPVRFASSRMLVQSLIRISSDFARAGLHHCFKAGGAVVISDVPA